MGDRHADEMGHAAACADHPCEVCGESAAAAIIAGQHLCGTCAKRHERR